MLKGTHCLRPAKKPNPASVPEPGQSTYALYVSIAASGTSLAFSFFARSDSLFDKLSTGRITKGRSFLVLRYYGKNVPVYLWRITCGFSKDLTTLEFYLTVTVKLVPGLPINLIYPAWGTLPEAEAPSVMLS